MAEYYLTRPDGGGLIYSAEDLLEHTAIIKEKNKKGIEYRLLTCPKGSGKCLHISRNNKEELENILNDIQTKVRENEEKGENSEEKVEVFKGAFE